MFEEIDIFALIGHHIIYARVETSHGTHEYVNILFN